ncbi:hypothetical protein G7Y89_g6577 [Cudoniella acicularis]|uniref:Uncharacterized protein n=1 Tax=Cudoniella acicularis TaxID=354080 RepID=A0A8H4W2Q9_9HELO|nr:hypothetical protein G7Y89_g6577 [Cudoniella acicularis]
MQLLERKYGFPTEATVSVAGKQFKVEFSKWDTVTIVSNLAPTGHLISPITKPQWERAAIQPQFENIPTTENENFQESPMNSKPSLSSISNIRLKHNYIGRLYQENPDRPLQAESIIEAALMFSRLLTKAGIHHVFPSFGAGAIVKLLAYHPPKFVPDGNYDQRPDVPLRDMNAYRRQDDREVMQAFFRAYLEAVAPMGDGLGVEARYTDAVHGENVRIWFPAITPKTDDWQKQWAKETGTHTQMGEVKLDPISLFNYRLNTVISRDLTSEEIDDFTNLYTNFERDLKHHKENIDVDNARLAAGMYEVVGRVLEDLSVELAEVKGKERRGDEEDELPGYSALADEDG